MALTLECGQHEDPNGPEVAYRAIRNTLAFFGLTDDAKPPLAANAEGLHIARVVDKLDIGDTFSRAWQSFDPLKTGDVIGTRANGEIVTAEKHGCILFPNAIAEAHHVLGRSDAVFRVEIMPFACRWIKLCRTGSARIDSRSVGSKPAIDGAIHAETQRPIALGIAVNRGLQ